MIFEPNKYVQAKFPPLLKGISNTRMYVFSDIVKLSNVCKSKIPIMGLFPITIIFKKMDIGIQSACVCKG